MILALLMLLLGVAGLGFLSILLYGCRAERIRRPSAEAVLLGAVTNFFDTLGIGSFAPTMAWMKFRKLVPDRLIPPTLITGHSLPTLTESLIFLALLGVRVDPVLLVGCIVAMLIGGHVGVALVQRAPVRLIQLLVAVALLVAGGFYTLTNLGVMPGGGHAVGLPPRLMLIAIGGHFVLGILLNFGVGTYAPTLAMLGILGMDPRLAFPIMASAGAFCMGTSGMRLVRKGELDLKIVLGMAIGGIPAVLVAAFLVRDMPIELLRWMVVGIVLYAAAILLRSALSTNSLAEGTKIEVETRTVSGSE